MYTFPERDKEGINLVSNEESWCCLTSVVVISLSLPLSPSRKIMLYFAHQLPPLSSSVTIVSHPTRQLHTTKESTLHPIRSFGHGDQAGSASIATAIDLSFPPFPINCLSSARKWTTTPIDAPKTMANTLCSVFRRWRLHYGWRDLTKWSLSNRW